MASFAALNGAFATAVASAASCTPRIFDGGGYVFEFKGEGSLSDGGSHGPTEVPPGPVFSIDAWDDWGELTVSAVGVGPVGTDLYPNQGDCTLGLGGQEIAYPPAPLHGLEVSRREFVDPGALHGVRILTVLHNPSAAAVSVDVSEGSPLGLGDLGSDEETAPRATSDGSNVLSAASRWGVTSDDAMTDGDPALAHLWDGPGGVVHVSAVALKEDDALSWTWSNVSVAPGATQALVSYEILEAVPDRSTRAEVAGAVAQAQAREAQPPASLYAGMSVAEIAGTLNWPHPSPAAKIAPVLRANAANPVLLDASASAGPLGLPQCATNHFAWKTDDGATGSAATLSHFFVAGEHRATLTASNDCGGSQSTEVSFRVEPGLQLGKAKVNRKTGTAKLVVEALGPGKLTLSGKGVKKQAKSLKKAGKVTLIVRPTGKALARLRSAGRAKVRVTVSLTPTGGVASKQSKKVALSLVR